MSTYLSNYNHRSFPYNFCFSIFLYNWSANVLKLLFRLISQEYSFIIYKHYIKLLYHDFNLTLYHNKERALRFVIHTLNGQMDGSSQWKTVYGCFSGRDLALVIFVLTQPDVLNNQIVQSIFFRYVQFTSLTGLFNLKI